MGSRLDALLSPRGIALVYLAFGLLALGLSDVVLPLVVEDPVALREYQATKGAVEVVLTAGLIYVLVSAYRRSAERKTRQVEEARDRFAFLNNLLRHNVLNRMNVVQGYVDEMLERGEADPSDLQTVRLQSEAVVDLVENVRALAQPPEAGYDARAVDLSAVLAAEVERARTEHPRASVTAEVPDGVAVRADDSLPLVFEHLIHNGIQHNDSEHPEVALWVDVGRRWVTVRVADDGPGIPSGALSGPDETERRGHEGTGLFLVRTLISRYGGDVRLGDTAGDGGLVVVELPRASSEPRDVDGVGAGLEGDAARGP